MTFAKDIFTTLTYNELHPEMEVCDFYSLIRVRNVVFIAAEQFSPTTEAAAAQSESIALRLKQLREGVAPDDAKSQATGIENPITNENQTMVIAGDMWHRHKEMMTARMLAHCGIFSRVFARNCDVRRLDRPQANAFMNANHSYGAASCRHCYGLFAVRRTVSKAYNGSRIIEPGTLVAAAEFSNARRWKKGGKEIRSFEWVRYASLPDLRINGGMGKILSKFIDDLNPDDIMSYADLEWSDGEVYRQLGFIPDGAKSPVMFAIDTETFIRTPLGSRKTDNQLTVPATDAHKKIGRTEPSPDKRIVYYQNFGSIKYRLSL